MNRLVLPAAVVSACAIIVLPAAYAQNNGVEIQVGAVVASNAGQSFDERLVALRKPLKALFPYSSYQLLRQEKRELKWGSSSGFDLPGGRFLVVIPRAYKDNLVSLQIMLISSNTRPVVQTAITLRDKGTFLVGGPRFRDGVLLIAIGANTVNRAEPAGTVSEASAARAAAAAK